MRLPETRLGDLYADRKRGVGVGCVVGAGAAHDLRALGMYAMDSMRTEKAHHSWKTDLSTDYTMLEAGLERFVKWDKADFVGKQSLLREHQAGAQQAFVSLTLDAAECDAPYLATVWDGDVPVGLVTSGNYRSSRWQLAGAGSGYQCMRTAGSHTGS